MVRGVIRRRRTQLRNSWNWALRRTERLTLGAKSEFTDDFAMSQAYFYRLKRHLVIDLAKEPQGEKASYRDRPFRVLPEAPSCVAVCIKQIKVSKDWEDACLVNRLPGASEGPINR